MLKTRIIPCLLLMNGQLYKTVKFKNPKYVGDPINAVRIFNEKEVDELILVDILASKKKHIDTQLLSRISKEAFMPLAYCGGIKSIKDAEVVLSLGYEKIVINSATLDDKNIVKELSSVFGSQSVVVCIDMKKNIFGKHVLFDYRTNKVYNNINFVDYVKELEVLGAGEIIIHCVDREGTGLGYDYEFLKSISSSLDIPTVALGGAKTKEDLKKAVVDSGVTGVAASSMFVFYGKYKAVLITYPNKVEVDF